VAEPEPGPGVERGPNSYAPKPRFEYRAPSFLWEYRYLLLVFVAVLIVTTVLLFRAPHRRYKIDPLPPEPVYVEPIPERPASSAH
jgi:hypothetical protein